ncbi:MAG: GTPase [Acidobacteria bacterium]|nr:GTPase [Acidobacteriota bacterium]
MQNARRVLIMGAAGRDFHNFNVFYRNNRAFEVVAFTAYQIPNIDGRTYPPELAGGLYPRGIPIYNESELPELIRRLSVDEVVFSYSDVSHLEVMHRASLANAHGADFRLLGTRATTLVSNKPVVSVCAVRTGCGKSQTSRRIAELLKRRGKSVVVVRHPMPYGPDLNRQRCQRFVTLEDLDRHQCTIEEREEYEAHIRMQNVVYAGVDYEEILHRAEQEAEVILWDGGNNDLPFFRSDLHVVLVDPHRPGHELAYHPGETNLRMANVVVVSKSDSAPTAGIERVIANVRRINPGAQLIRAESVVHVDDEVAIKGKRVLVVEDGPTLTHGEMTYGAAHVAATRFGAAEIVDPRPYAVGSIRDVFETYDHLVDVLPAMGYGDKQVRELEETINAVPCDLVLIGTPFDLTRLIHTKHPVRRVTYALDEASAAALSKILHGFLESREKLTIDECHWERDSGLPGGDR